MFDIGGMDILKDDKWEVDILNFKGYFEYELVMLLYKDSFWLDKG